ncbi:ATPase with chaperone activity [Macromonas nakdongensis]|uniref:ATPase with chaperone activity n=1 Tax=Macromonas nakdongensis TaxID=1843082 RepID=UPI000C321BA7|nr:ATPase with chaperone activity [Macromonas nakdongensis]
MSDSQIHLPPSFVAVHTPPGRLRPLMGWAELVQRHECCEDMAQMLVEPAAQILVRLGIAEHDVLNKVWVGLSDGEVRLSEAEGRWVVCRLAELLQWPVPAGIADGVPVNGEASRG